MNEEEVEQPTTEEGTDTEPEEQAEPEITEEQTEPEPVEEPPAETPEPVDLSTLESDLQAIRSLLESEFSKTPTETIIEVPSDNGDLLGAVEGLNESVIWVFAVQFIIIGFLFFNLFFTAMKAGKS